MVDKVKPLKFETSADGTQVDIYPTETNPEEDYIAAKGFSFGNSNSYLMERVGGIIKDLTPNYSHRPGYSGGSLSYLEIYNGQTQTTVNRLLRIDLTYTGDDLTTESWKIYDTSDGATVLKTITFTHTYLSNILNKTEVSET